jgi:hypothetical protein
MTRVKDVIVNTMAGSSDKIVRAARILSYGERPGASSELRSDGAAHACPVAKSRVTHVVAPVAAPRSFIAFSEAPSTLAPARESRRPLDVWAAF